MTSLVELGVSNFLRCAGAALFAWAMLWVSPASASGVDLRGGGATFPAIMYKTWIERFRQKQPETTIAYDVVGTGEGWARYAAGVIDFAASETPIPLSVVEKFENTIQAPATAGMIAVAYNLPGVASPLKLPRDVLADIFLGKITNWADPRIAAANPGGALPARPITPIVRKDSSGTTYAFTRHLSASNSAWREGPGFGKLISWRSHVATARGNDGVTEMLKRTEGALGYVEYGFALKAGLPVAALENRTGQYVAPSVDAGSATLALSKGSSVRELMDAVLDPGEPKAYPIVSFSLILLRSHYGEAQTRALKGFVSYLLGEGQQLAVEKGYLPLPGHVVAFSRNALSMVNGVEQIAQAIPKNAPAPPRDQTAPEPEPVAASPQAPRGVATHSRLTAASLMEPAKPLSYRVASHESLRDVATKIYRDPDQWIFIAAINPGVDAKHRLRVGQILRLP